MIPKSQMTEEDIKHLFITPAIEANWDPTHLTMETRITDGRINLRGNLVSRETPKKADYVLYITVNYPIAIVEAKDNNHAVSHGIQQAMLYAQMLDVPFAYSSNGDAFYEHDFLTGKERTIPLDAFPSPEELMSRYRQGANDGEGLNAMEEAIIHQPYYTSMKTHAPRYYQRIAINRTLDAMARGQTRILLVMATGTGKTFTAFQIIYRAVTSGLKRKVLYLADRNILVDQSIQQDFAPLKSITHKINVGKDNKTTIKSYQVYFSLYQQLVGDDDVEHFSDLFTPTFFDLIVVDECHRGSAKEESRWRRILEYFHTATQIGMTATPKETKYVSNINYFGEPLYTYSLRQGIEDGFLAPFKVINVKLDIGDGWRPYKGQKDIFGNEIPDRIYDNRDYDYEIIIEDRINQVAAAITKYLKSTDRYQKTIVFCAREDHAGRMRDVLSQMNADMVKENPDYVVRITGNDPYYTTFFIREKYGLNKQDRKGFIKDTALDILQSTVITLALGMILVFIGEHMTKWTNGFSVSLPAALLIAVAIAAVIAVFVIGASFFSIWILKKQYTFTPLPEGDLRNKVMALQSGAKKQVRIINVYDESKKSTSKNAFLLKFLWHREFGIADNFLNENAEDELLAVLSHEIGHLKHKKNLLNWLGYVFLGVLFILFVLVVHRPGAILNMNTWIRSSFNTSVNNYYILIAVYSACFTPLGKAIGIFNNYRSRCEEYEADCEAVKNGYGEALITTFKRLSSDELVNVNPHPIIEFLEYNHPGMYQRIKAIREAEGV